MRISQTCPQFNKISSTPTQKIVLKYENDSRNYQSHAQPEEENPAIYSLINSPIPVSTAQITNESPYRPIFRRKFTYDHSPKQEVDEAIQIESPEINEVDHEMVCEVDCKVDNEKDRETDSEKDYEVEEEIINPCSDQPIILKKQPARKQFSASPKIAKTTKFTRKLERNQPKETENQIEIDFQQQKMDKLLEKIDSLIEKTENRSEKPKGVENQNQIQFYESFQQEVQNQNLTQNQLVQQQKSMISQNQILQEQLLQMQKQILYLTEQREPSILAQKQPEKHSSAIQNCSVLSISSVTEEEEIRDLRSGNVNNKIQQLGNQKNSVQKVEVREIRDEKLLQQSLNQKNREESQAVKKQPVVRQMAQERIPQVNSRQNNVQTKQKIPEMQEERLHADYRPYAMMEDPYARKFVRPTKVVKPATPNPVVQIDPIETAMRNLDEKLAGLQVKGKDNIVIYDEDTEHLKSLNLYFQKQIFSLE